MRRFLLMMFTVFLSLGLIVSEAQAKRFGGGKSFGMQRNVATRSAPNGSASSHMQNVPKSATSSIGKSWLPALAGMALGGALATLFMGHGIGSGILSWLLIAVLGFFLIKFIRNRFGSPASAYATPASPNNYHVAEKEAIQRAASLQTNHSYAAHQHVFANTASNTLPAGFDQANFLRDAKAKFFRLQAAYFQRNTQDIRQFATPEVAAEIEMQWSEEPRFSTQDEIIDLNAELLDAANEFHVLIASVEFTGQSKDTASSQFERFAEVWHFRQSPQGEWLVAGIQQT